MTVPADSDALARRATLTLLCPGALASAGLPAATSIAARWPAGWRHAEPIERHDDDSLVARELPHEQWLRERFAIADADAVEAASAAIDGVAPPTIRLTPVHLHTGRDHLVLTDPQQLALSIDEASALAEAIRPLLDEHGLALTVATPLRWYLSGPADRLPVTTDIGSRQAVGRSVDAYLSRDAATRPWRRLLNEIQMTWYEHPLNQARASRRQPAVNSVWVEGRFTATPVAPAGTLLAGDDAAVQGLAAACRATLPDASATAASLAAAQAWLAGRGPRRDAVPSLILVAALWPSIDPLADPARFDAGWRAFGPWVAGLGAADGPPAGFDDLRVVLCGDRRRVGLRIGRHQRWKFWRSVRPDDWLERAPPIELPDAGPPAP